ncbi:MAG TPA: FAD binding domain-containing protein [Acidothermaceae bacterium]|nr:FAD binding domain-containing protein [Acidothermaceae bacterium]
MLPVFDIARPSTVAEAVALLDDDHVAYWGGTELLLAMKMGLLVPECLVDLKQLSELRDIRQDGNRLLIGAGATHDEIATSATVRALAPLLADVESRVGNARVRAQGTIGGNLCFAEPRSDVATVLMALGGSVRLESADSARSVQITDFVLGPYWTAREPGELLVAVEVPIPAADGIYLKFQVTERPTVGVAAVIVPSTQARRLAIGAVSEMPRTFEFDDWSQADPQALAGELEPVPDLTGSVEYKRHLTAVFIRRAIAAVEGGTA